MFLSGCKFKDFQEPTEKNDGDSKLFSCQLVLLFTVILDQLLIFGGIFLVQFLFMSVGVSHEM